MKLLDLLPRDVLDQLAHQLLAELEQLLLEAIRRRLDSARTPPPPPSS